MRRRVRLALKGAAFHGGGRVIARSLRSRSPLMRRVELRAEPDNPVDPAAVAVWMRGTRIGYAPKRVAKGLGLILRKGEIQAAELVDTDEIEINLKED